MKVAIVLAFAVGCALAAPSDKCGKNEQFNECGSACEPSCKLPEPLFCTMQCIIGCQCKPGFFRNDAGACVTKDECPNIDLCAGHKCPEGKKCFLRPVQCFAAPCDPIPDCN